jgi:phosphatidylserine synthase 2
VQLLSAQDARQRSIENAKKGVWAVVFVYLGYSSVQGPSTPHMVRPHPSFWKFVHGVMICYLSFMVFLLFQSVNDARLFLKVCDCISLQKRMK